MASTRDWFESVAEAQRRAKRVLPRAVYAALVAGTESGTTSNDNVDAFAELRFRPRIGESPPPADLTTTVLGQEVSFPVLCAPTGVQAVDPEGEVPVARAATAAGTAMCLSSFASRPVEEVGRAAATMFFQSYWVGDREAMLARAERGRAAGAKALIVTLDWVFDSRRDWGSPWIPERIDLGAMARYAPQVVTRPTYMARWIRQGRLPDLGVPNLAADRGSAVPTFFGAYAQWMNSERPTWEDVAWLREKWGGPFMVKGVGHPDDARRARDAGATAVSVSNHGGNNLDSTLASIRMLPAVVDAVGGDIEVLLDGGVRRGSDVVKALALGARAVLIGRAYLWGLAANGEQGVTNVLSILRSGITETLFGLGRSAPHELEPGDVLVPERFTYA